MACRLTEDQVLLDKFSEERNDQLMENVLNTIEKHLSPGIQHKINYTEEDKQNIALDQINELPASNSHVRHEKRKTGQ